MILLKNLSKLTTSHLPIAQAVHKLFHAKNRPTPAAKSLVTIGTLVYFLILIASISLSSLTVIQVILNYLNYEVTTTSRTIHEAPALFPKITFCNWNLFTTEKSIDFLKKINAQLYPNMSIFDRDQMKHLSQPEKSTLMNAIFQNAISQARYNLSLFEKQQLGHRLDDILLRCSFDNQPCSAKDFTWSFDQIDGNCFTFNSGYEEDKEDTGRRKKVPLKKSNIAGWTFGLNVMLYAKFHENLIEFNSYTGDGLGIYLDVGNSSTGLSSHDFGGIYISPGYLTNVVLTRTFKYMLPKPYSNCLIDDESFDATSYELVDLVTKSSYKYTNEVCLEQCYQKLLIEKCKCVNQWFLTLFNVTEDCSLTLKTNDCMNDFYAIAFNSSDAAIIDACGLECPLECNITEISSSLSYIGSIGDLGADLIKANKNLSADFVTTRIDAASARQSIVQLCVYYNSLTYSLSTETPQINFVSLLADIGGNLGLFLGVSTFTLCEMIEILIRIFVLND